MSLLRYVSRPSCTPPSKSFKAIIASSHQAFEQLAIQHPLFLEENKTKPLYVVGKRAAHAAWQYGFSYIVHQALTGADLGVFLKETYKENVASILWLRGKKIQYDFKKNLSTKNFSVSEVVLYDTRPALNLSPDVVKLIKEGGLDAVTLYSAYTGKILGSLLSKHQLMPFLEPIYLFALSKTIAQSIAPLFKNIRAPDRPTQEELLKQISNTLNL